MKVGVNTRFLLSNKMEGFGWFTYETMKRITKNHPEVQFYFFFDRLYDEKFVFSENITPIVLNPPARHPILQKIWFNWSVTRALKKHHCDCFISPDGYVSLRTKVPQLAVMHDLNFEHNPEDVPPNALRFLKRNFPKFARKAKRICTVSNSSKKDIVNTYHIPVEKIDVTYNGSSPLFKPLLEEEKEHVRNKFTNDHLYVVFVGAIHKRKNLQRLIHAFQQLKLDTNLSHHILIVGEAMWKSQAISIPQEMKEYVHFTGHLSMEDLTHVMGAATCLAFVSYFEGFGIPIVEAMQSGVPVLAGNRTSLPEIAGEAALYCNPFSEENIQLKLTELLQDEELQNRLIQKGFQQAEKFSWDKTAEGLWEAVLKL